MFENCGYKPLKERPECGIILLAVGEDNLKSNRFKLNAKQKAQISVVTNRLVDNLGELAIS